MLNKWNHQRAGAYLLWIASIGQAGTGAKTTEGMSAILKLIEAWQAGKYYTEMGFRDVLKEYGFSNEQMEYAIRSQGLKNG